MLKFSASTLNQELRNHNLRKLPEKYYFKQKYSDRMLLGDKIARNLQNCDPASRL